MLHVHEDDYDQEGVYPAALAVDRRTGKVEATVYITDVPKGKKTIPRTFEAGRDSAIVACPQDRECGLIVGPSGVGKSTWMAEYGYYYKLRNPKNMVYIFTPKTADPAYDRLRQSKRVEIIGWRPFMKGATMNEVILGAGDESDTGYSIIPDVSKLTSDTLKNSLLIFDDIDMIPDAYATKALKELRARMMFTGRHDNISVITSNHQFRDYSGRLNAPVLSEANFVVIFPGNGNEPAIQSLLQEQFQVSNSVAKSVTETKNRSVYIRRSSRASIPFRYAVTPRYIQLLLT